MKIKLRLDQLIRERAVHWNRHITYKEISEATGVAETTLVKWRKGRARRVDLDILERVAEYLDCQDINEILILHPDGDGDRPQLE